MAKLILGGHLSSCSTFFENKPDEICSHLSKKSVLRPISAKITSIGKGKEKASAEEKRKQAIYGCTLSFYNCYLAENLKKVV